MVDVALSSMTVDVIFPAGVTVDLAIESPIVEVTASSPAHAVKGLKTVRVETSAWVTETENLPAGALLTYVVAYGSGGGTITVEMQTTGGDIFTDEEYTATGRPVLFRPMYFLSIETLGMTTTGAATVILYYY